MSSIATFNDPDEYDRKAVQIRKEIEQEKRLDKADKTNNWLNAYRSIFEKANQIVTGLPVTLELAEPLQQSPTAPGWTDGQTISLNREVLTQRLNKGETRELILGIKGVNYHEVAHCLFTPRVGTALSKQVEELARTKGYQYWWAFNALEDQRAETLFAGSFGQSIIYFTHSVAEFILDRPQEVGNMWSLLSGRTYLPTPLRSQLRSLYVAQNPRMPVDTLDEIVTKYKTLIFPRDQKSGFSLIKEFSDLFSQNQSPGSPRINQVSGGHGSPGDGLKKGRPAPKAAQENAQENLDVAEEEWADKADASEASPGKSKTKSEKSDDDNDTPDGEPGQGIGTGESDGDILPPDLASLEEQVKDLMEEINESDQFQEDVKETLDAVKAETSAAVGPTGRQSKFNWEPVPNEYVTMKNVMVRHIRSITADLEPDWKRRQDSGHINLERAMFAQHGELDVFDQWDEGQEDQAEVEVMILLDQSSSMTCWDKTNTRIVNASRVLWALQNAFSRLKIRSTVLGFAYGHTILYKPNEPVASKDYRQFGADGGTDPTEALTEAYRILRNSVATHKIVIVLTDGDWNDHLDYQRTIKRLKKSNVFLMLMELSDPYYSTKHTHGFHLRKKLGSITDAGPAVEMMVKELIQGKWGR